MADIGNLALRMSASAEPLKSTLDSSLGNIKRWANDAGAAFKNVESALGGPTKMLSGMRDLAGSGFLAAIPGASQFAAVLGTITTSLGSLIDAGFKSSKEQNDLVRNFGVTSEGAATLQQAARLSGVTIEEMTPSLRRLQRSLGESNVGFRTLGLSAQELRGVGLDVALERIGGALGRVDSVSAAMAARNIFGRQADTAIRFARQMAVAREQAELLGLAMTQADRDALKAAEDRLKQTRGLLGAATQRLGQEAASFFAPIVEAAANAIALVAKAFSAMREEARALATEAMANVRQTGGVTTGQAFGIALSPFATQEFTTQMVAEGRRNMEAAIARARQRGVSDTRITELLQEQAGGASGAYWARVAREILGGQADQAQGLAAAVAGASTTIDQQTDSLRNQAAAFGMSASAAQALAAAQRLATEQGLSLAQAQEMLAPTLRENRAAAAAAGMVQFANSMQTANSAMSMQVATFGMSSREAQIHAAQIEANRREDELMAAGTAGLSAAQIRGLQRARDAANQALDNMRAADRQLNALEIMRQTQTPFERFQEDAERLRAQMAAGLDIDVAARRAMQLADQLERANGAANMQGPGALLQGSSAAISALNRWQRTSETSSESPAERMRRVMEEARDIQRQQLEQQRRWADDLRAGRVFRAVGGF